MFKRFIILLSLCAAPGMFCQAQHRLNFDAAERLTTTDGAITFSLSSVRALELSEGISGNAMRTDGYSTWIETETLAEPVTSVSGWFAIESYPVDTAAFIGAVNAAGESMAVCFDRFGKVLIGTGKDGKYKYVATNGKVDKFQWIHVSMEKAQNGVAIYLNGRKLSFPAKKYSFDGIGKIVLGRDFRDKRNGQCLTVLLNGLMDEICISDKPIGASGAKVEYLASKDTKAVLAIPETRFAGDFNKPVFHIQPAANWTNESHALFWYNGRYHIFNQKNASGLYLQQMNWGHFSSPDLLNWTEHKPAITPEPGYDENGIWSGHAVIDDNGVPVLIYTAGGSKYYGVGLAYPKDINDPNLVEWVKYKGNPIVPHEPAGYTRTDPRDQYVWKEGDTWYMIIGFGIVEDNVEKGAVLLYKSKDFKKWDFVHTMFEGDPAADKSGVFWEMPTFFKLGGKYILMVNKTPERGDPARCFYWTGDFVNERFVPDNKLPQQLDVINHMLSPSLSYDTEGNFVAIGITAGGFNSYKSGWTHLMGAPRVWTLENGRIAQKPHPVLKNLRDKKTYIEAEIDSQNPLLLSRGRQQVEVKTSFANNTASKYGFKVRANADGSEYTLIYFDAQTNEMVIDGSHSSKSAAERRAKMMAAPRGNQQPPRTMSPEKRSTYAMQSGKPADFQIIIDASIIEVFINGKEAFGTRAFTDLEGSNQVEVFVDGGTADVKAEVWSLKPAELKTDF